MKFNLFDLSIEDFYPLTLTRPIGDLRIGISTITEKWENALGADAGHTTKSYLQSKFPHVEAELAINSRWIPESNSGELVNSLEQGQALVYGEMILAAKFPTAQEISDISDFVEHPGTPFLLSGVTDLFAENERAIALEFEATAVSDQVKRNNTLYGENFHIHPSAQVRGAILNSETGPVYIGPNAQVMEGSLIRGPFVLCEEAHVKMGSKIYGATTVGPHSRVGGEITNSVIQGYSNKGHDGFLGNSVIGHWCNLGADTNISNLKNNYSSVKVWDYAKKEYRNTGLTFCGLIMGDHSKSAINTQFNTGTVVGANVNVFDSGFPPKFIPSFSWGGSTGFTAYNFDKAMEVCERVCARRKVVWTDEDVSIMRHIQDNLVDPRD
jgi:UDP-N-acetylglucosamine diphosphorylase/glucosamine-1-phosphate N-acetyltransferase